MTEAENPRAVKGSNRSPFELLKDREEELLAGAAKWVTDHPFNVNLRDMDAVQDEINKLSDFKNQLTAFWKEADGERKIEKKPHDDAAQAVQDKYNPLLDGIKKRGTAVADRLTQWMTHLTGLRNVAREQEEKRLREQKEAAEKAAREADELARKAEAGELAGSGVDVFAAQEKAEQAKAQVKEQEKTVRAVSGTVKGGTGVVDGRKKSAALHTYYSAQIDNIDLLCRFFLHQKAPGLLNVLQQLADAAVKADPKDPPPGVTVLSRQQAQ